MRAVKWSGFISEKEAVHVLGKHVYDRDNLAPMFDGFDDVVFRLEVGRRGDDGIEGFTIRIESGPVKSKP